MYHAKDPLRGADLSELQAMKHNEVCVSQWPLDRFSDTTLLQPWFHIRFVHWQMLVFDLM